MTGTDLGGYGAIEQYVNDIGSPLPVFKDHPPNSAIPESLGGLVYLIDQGDGLEVWSRSRGEDPVRLGGGGSGGGGSSTWSENADGALEPKDGQPVSVEQATIGGDTGIGVPATSSDGSLTVGGGWTTIDANNPSWLLLRLNAETDGSTDGNVLAEIDESGGTTADYKFIQVVAHNELGGGNIVPGAMMQYVPAGAQVQVRSVFDPNNNNNVAADRVFTL
jgi:hypothetical protein